MHRTLRQIVITALGTVAYVGLRYSLHVIDGAAIDQAEVVRTGTSPIPLWYSIVRPPLFSIMQVVPAFVVGWLVARRGALLGAIVGAVGYYLYTVLFSVHWHLGPSIYGVADVSIDSLPAIVGVMIVTAVSGVAGELLQTRLH